VSNRASCPGLAASAAPAPEGLAGRFMNLGCVPAACMNIQATSSHNASTTPAATCSHRHADTMPDNAPAATIAAATAAATVYAPCAAWR
jgi:hypothetical protein